MLPVDPGPSILGTSLQWVNGQYLIFFKLYEVLKTLFNIVEARFLKYVELWCLCCIMMFRRVNKQPGMQKFWELCCYYQDIYNWMSPFNKPSCSWFILTLQAIGGNECGISGHLHIFTSLKHLIMLLKCSFSGLHFYTLSQTLIACRAMQLRFLKVETLLNNTFNIKDGVLHVCRGKSITWKHFSVNISFKLNEIT